MSIEQLLDYIRTQNIEEADRFFRETLRYICDEQKIICLDHIQVSVSIDWVTDKTNVHIIRDQEINIPYPEILQ